MKESFSFAVMPEIELGRPVLDLTDWFRGTEEAVVGKELDSRLVAAINFLNTINTIPEIDFVATAGDLTDSALPEQFLKVKEIMDKLSKPWLPVIGNHDLWPYQKLPDSILSRRHSWEDNGPNGPRIFSDIFQENFQKLSILLAGWQRQYTLLQNYAFLHNSVRLIIVDNMGREHAIAGFPGVIGLPKLYPETWQWLQKQLSKEEEMKIVISHAPLKKGLLEAISGNKKIVNIAGHVHKEQLRESNNITIFTTGALYLRPVVTIVKVLPDGRVEFNPVRIPSGYLKAYLE